MSAWVLMMPHFRLGGEARGGVCVCVFVRVRGCTRRLMSDALTCLTFTSLLPSNADVIKIMCIVAIRSFLGWERGKEMAHMQHEVDHWKKAHNALLR